MNKRFIEKEYSEENIILIPLRSLVTSEDIRHVYPKGSVVVCDCRIQGIEKGESVPGGYNKERILNIDHHAPTPEMSRVISSTNLAIKYITEVGQLAQEIPIVLNHTDCDSILSASIMRELLPPEEQFGKAALAADHLGTPDPIADLLQPLQKLRDFSASFSALQALLHGQPLPDYATEALAERLSDRQRVSDLVKAEAFEQKGSITYLITDSGFDTSLLPSLLPQALIILIFSPLKEASNTWLVNYRLGPQAPQCLSLHLLSLNSFDPAFGGRWNAGSNKRGGGTSIPPQEYASLVNEKVEAFLKEKHEQK